MRSDLVGGNKRRGAFGLLPGAYELEAFLGLDAHRSIADCEDHRDATNCDEGRCNCADPKDYSTHGERWFECILLHQSDRMFLASCAG